MTCEPSSLNRRYRRELFGAMVVYVILILGSFTLIRHLDLPTWTRALLALLPFIGVALVARAQLRYLAGCDELQLKIELHAISLATGGLIFGSFPLGLLAAAKVFSIEGGVVLIWILPTFFLLYGACKFWAVRRLA